jgi:hypothetical protein
VLIWNKAGPWKRIVAYRKLDPHNFPAPHYDSVESFLDHAIPPEKTGPLAEFDGSVVFNRTRGELLARCHDEEANFLALNLANDVATGQESVEKALDYYAHEFLAYRRKDPPVHGGAEVLPERRSRSRSQGPVGRATDGGGGGRQGQASSIAAASRDVNRRKPFASGLAPHATAL